jgi:hypothetical protein
MKPENRGSKNRNSGGSHYSSSSYSPLIPLRLWSTLVRILEPMEIAQRKLFKIERDEARARGF